MRKIATVSELAEIFGVTRSAISQAVTSGRLSKSVSKTTKNHRRFEIYSACLEWENARDNGQVRGPRPESEDDDGQDFPPVAESRQAFEYYQAMNEEITALKAAGKLVDLELCEREVFHAARIMRDRLLEISEKSRFTFLALGLSDADAESLVRSLSDEITDALLYLSELNISDLREAAASEALKQAAEELTGVRNG